MQGSKYFLVTMSKMIVSLKVMKYHVDQLKKKIYNTFKENLSVIQTMSYNEKSSFENIASFTDNSSRFSYKYKQDYWDKVMYAI